MHGTLMHNSHTSNIERLYIPSLFITSVNVNDRSVPQQIWDPTKIQAEPRLPQGVRLGSLASLYCQTPYTILIYHPITLPRLPGVRTRTQGSYRDPALI